jgi:Concanavalin A-like lectin/glucanases superfamily
MAVIPGTGASQGSIAPTGDPHFPNVVLLLHGQGGDGSTTFTDRSRFNIPLTAAGNVRISSGQARIGPSSIYFDGTGDYLFNDDQSFWDFGAGDLTVEFWYFCTDTGSKVQGLVDLRNAGGGPGEPFITLNTADLRFDIADTTRFQSLGRPANVWRNVALSRNSGVYRAFLDGVQIGSPYSNSLDLSTGGLTIGSFRDFRSTASTMKFIGYMQEIRITKGIGRYASNFIPQDRPFPDY